jgi:hypothetical protein
MNAAIALLVLISFEAIIIVNAEDSCSSSSVMKTDCGLGCTGRPRCGGSKRCGNVDDVCYCDCSKLTYNKCRPTALGWRWNNGAKNSDGSYKFNGVNGDGHYVC